MELKCNGTGASIAVDPCKSEQTWNEIQFIVTVPGHALCKTAM